MPEKQALEILEKHNIDPTDVKNKKVSLHHLRHIVRSDELPYPVFRELVRMRR
ncbi:MAG: hypothetical protein WBX15_04845 [Thermoanaerobaculia bacterium]